jgi:YVTN family beta-propeller protein
MHIQHRVRTVARAFFAAAVFCFVAIAALQATAQQPYRILDRWKLADAGWWDYLTVDSPAHRLYLTRGDHVDVLDTTNGKLVGTVTGLQATHGVVFDATRKFGYVTDSGLNAVVKFDLATLQTVATIPAGTGPDGAVFEPATQTVWAFNGRSKNVTVISTKTDKVIATIALPGKPEFPVADGTGTVYDNIEDKSEIVRLDAHSLKMTANWAAGCESPSGLAIDVPGHRLFPVCDGNKMAVVDSRNGNVLATPAIGDGPDAARWSAQHNLAFASCGEGVLSVVDASTPAYKTIQSLQTQRGARTMAYDAATDRIYVVTAEFGPRPPATPQNPRRYPPMIPGSFTVIVIGR